MNIKKGKLEAIRGGESNQIALTALPALYILQVSKEKKDVQEGRA